LNVEEIVKIGNGNFPLISGWFDEFATAPEGKRGVSSLSIGIVKLRHSKGRGSLG